MMKDSARLLKLAHTIEVIAGDLCLRNRPRTRENLYEAAYVLRSLAEEQSETASVKSVVSEPSVEIPSEGSGLIDAVSVPPILQREIDRVEQEFE